MRQSDKVGHRPSIKNKLCKLFLSWLSFTAICPARMIEFGNWNMSVELSLKAAPFHLNHEDIAWVRKTRDALSTEAKVRQLLCIFQLTTISNRRVNLEA